MIDATHAVHTGDAVIRPMHRQHIDRLMPFERDMFGAEAWTRGGYLGELADRRTRTYVVAEQSVAEQSVAEQSVAEPSVAEQSVAEQSVAEQSVAEQSVAEQNVAEQNVAEQDAAEDAALLGWAGIRVLGDEAEILTVGVVPAARRRHIGRQLLDALLAVAHEKGATDVYLEVRVDNAAARALYHRAGFTDVGVRRGYYDHGRVDAVVMHRHDPPRAAGQ